MRSKIIVASMSLFLCVAVLFALSCSSLITKPRETTPAVTWHIDFDRPLTDSNQKSLDTPEALSISELQRILSAVEQTTAPASFGGYQLSGADEGLLNAATSYLTQQEYGFGYVMMDLSSGYGVASNINTEFYSASSIKAPYVVSLLASSPETIDYWAWSMDAIIEYSDNDEYFTLRSLYDSAPLVKWCEKAGVDTSFCPEWFPWYSTKTLAKLWLNNYEYFESDVVGSSEVFSWFGATNNSVISANLGGYYPVCTKAGWIADEEFSATIDAGIVYAGKSPYLIIIMTDAPDDMESLDSLVLALNEIHDRMILARANQARLADSQGTT
ncbi:MAG: hypothetical protein LBP91_04105 [Coriobacteriales bacterium]|nr:hypothetical protein [Coriobacteriales bacterium]